jgi:hypothetical protein
MKFTVVYTFNDSLDEEIQIDIVEAKNENECRKRFNKKEYTILEVKQYDEDAIEQEMLEDIDIDDNEDIYAEDDNDDDDIVEDGLRTMFPNADTEEDLEEELEHSLTRMLDR